MAFKVSKPQALKLFMFVRHLKFSFDPFSTEARSIRGALLAGSARRSVARLLRARLTRSPVRAQRCGGR